jgi:RNA polymerase sigma-70 factor, ECF subfamily
MNKDGLNKKVINFSSFSSGDNKTFDIIFNNNYGALVGFCLQFIPDVEEAKNIAQQAIIKLWLNRKKVERITGIRAFLYTAAKTDCLNYLRHEKYRIGYIETSLKQKEYQLNSEILESFNFNRLEYAELEELIQEAVDNLPERCRLVFIKSRFEEKKNQEIADELGIALKSVESNMTRALKILRNELKDYLPVVGILLGL